MHMRHKDLPNGAHLEVALHELMLGSFAGVHDPSVEMVVSVASDSCGNKRTHMRESSLSASEDTLRVSQGRPAAVPRNCGAHGSTTWLPNQEIGLTVREMWSGIEQRRLG